MGDITQKGLNVYSGRGLTLVSEVAKREQQSSVHRESDSSDPFDYERAVSVDERAYTDAREWQPQTGFEQISVGYDLLDGEERNEVVINMLLNYTRYTLSYVFGQTTSASREEFSKDERGGFVVGGQITKSMVYVFKCIHVDAFFAEIHDGTVNMRAAVRMCSMEELHDYMDEFKSSQDDAFYRYHATETCVEDKSGRSVESHTGEWIQGRLIAESSQT